MRCLVIIMQVICYIALGVTMEYFNAPVVFFAFVFFLYGIACTYVNCELTKPRK